MNRPAVAGREAAFWDENVAPLDVLRAEYEAGPDQVTAALIQAVEPLGGRRVLDFACGAGVLSCWLADRGADVLGADVSPGSIARACELADACGSTATFVAGTVPGSLEGRTFDRVCGRYALHHTDVPTMAPLLAGLLDPGGFGSFLETMATNPLFRVARPLAGWVGVARYGTPDERPLRGRDLDALRGAFGALEIRVPRIVVLRLLDRQVFHYRSRVVSRLVGAADDALGRIGLARLSYQQLLVVGPAPDYLTFSSTESLLSP